MKFAVIEGLDGSGKSTQIKLLKAYLDENKVPFKYLHFPRTDTSVYGDLVSRFLRGELGDIDQVNPYLVALIFAGDRNDAKNQIISWLEEGYFVLLDRYVNSNIAFQCAKLKTQEEKTALQKWIIDLEYNYHKLPVPDINIFLNVPFSFTTSQLMAQRSGSDRDYLKGMEDIHEQNLDFQAEVRDIYLSLRGMNNYKILDCGDENGNILPPEKIFRKIKETIFL